MDYLRIKKNSDFTKLFKKGKRIFSPTLSLICFPSDKIRLGIVVSKKHGNAVKRNRIKRLLREVFRKNLHLLNGGWSIILIPAVAENYTYKTFEKSMISCFKKVNLCKA